MSVRSEVLESLHKFLCSVLVGLMRETMLPRVDLGFSQLFLGFSFAK